MGQYKKNAMSRSSDGFFIDIALFKRAVPKMVKIMGVYIKNVKRDVAIYLVIVWRYSNTAT